MNIFVTDPCPLMSARNLCHEHLSKMVAESAQMLQNCFTLEQLQHAPLTKTGKFRKHSYYNHPCSKWVRASSANAGWLILHALEMAEERRRYNYSEHFSSAFIEWAADNMKFLDFNDHSLHDFSIAINPNQNCRRVPGFDCLDRVSQYRLYYHYDKPFATWTRGRQVPFFMSQDWALQYGNIVT